MQFHRQLPSVSHRLLHILQLSCFLLPGLLRKLRSMQSQRADYLHQLPQRILPELRKLHPLSRQLRQLQRQQLLLQLRFRFHPNAASLHACRRRTNSQQHPGQLYLPATHLHGLRVPLRYLHVYDNQLSELSARLHPVRRDLPAQQLRKRECEL